MIVGILFFALAGIIIFLLALRDHRNNTKAIQRYAQSLKDKDKKDDKDFIFVDPEETESLRRRLEENEDEELNAIMAETDREDEEYYW